MSCTPQYTIRNAGRQTKSIAHCFQTPFLTHIHVCMSLKEREKERASNNEKGHVEVGGGRSMDVENQGKREMTSCGVIRGC